MEIWRYDSLRRGLRDAFLVGQSDSIEKAVQQFIRMTNEFRSCCQKLAGKSFVGDGEYVIFYEKKFKKEDNKVHFHKERIFNKDSLEGLIFYQLLKTDEYFSYFLDSPEESLKKMVEVIPPCQCDNIFAERYIRYGTLYNYYVCKECGGAIDVFQEEEWIKENRKYLKNDFTIPKRIVDVIGDLITIDSEPPEEYYTADPDGNYETIEEIKIDKALLEKYTFFDKVFLYSYETWSGVGHYTIVTLTEEGKNKNFS